MLQRTKSLRLLRDTVTSSLRLGQTAGVVGRTGVAWLLGERPPTPELLRQTFERLGSTYIKLGQFVASAPSLFPREYVDAFQGCLDAAPPIPYATVEAILREEFDRPLEHIYRHIDPEPMALSLIHI